MDDNKLERGRADQIEESNERLSTNLRKVCYAATVSIASLLGTSLAIDSGRISKEQGVGLIFVIGGMSVWYGARKMYEMLTDYHNIKNIK